MITEQRRLVMTSHPERGLGSHAQATTMTLHFDAAHLVLEWDREWHCVDSTQSCKASNKSSTGCHDEQQKEDQDVSC